MATLVDALCDAENTEHSLKLSAKNAHSYGYPFKSSSLAEYKGYIIPALKDECYPSPFCLPPWYFSRSYFTESQYVFFDSITPEICPT